MTVQIDIVRQQLLAMQAMVKSLSQQIEAALAVTSVPESAVVLQESGDGNVEPSAGPSVFGSRFIDRHDVPR